MGKEMLKNDFKTKNLCVKLHYGYLRLINPTKFLKITFSANTININLRLEFHQQPNN